MEDLKKYIDSEGHAVLPDGISEIPEKAFQSCSSLTSIILPDSVSRIGKRAFEYCENLTSITVPDSAVIGMQAFNGCKGLADKDGFVIIRGTLYSYHGKETSLVIPENVKKIDFFAFSDNKNLTSVVVPGSVSAILEDAFWNCTNLTTIVIPASVTYIADDRGYEGPAFENCPNLTVVCSEGSYVHDFCRENSLPFIYDYQYKAYGGLIPPGYKKLASPFLADEEKPFIFISYSHKDRDEVLQIIKTLYESGWKVWYDEGLTIGDSYDETLENHVRDCSAFLLFVTQNSLNSIYCKENEIPWAVQYGKPIIRCILDEKVEYPIREDAVAATVTASDTESALEKIEGLIKGGKRIAKGISVVVNPVDRDEADGDGFACYLYAEKTDVIKAILYEAENSGCSLHDLSVESDSGKLQRSTCLVVFLDKAFLADKYLTDILINEYQAGKDIAVCMIENIEDTDLPHELTGLHKMQWLNYVHGISNDMNTKLFRHLQKKGCRNTAILPGFEYEKTDKGIIIKKYTGLNPNPRIESEYGGVHVVEIDNEAFCNNLRIQSVILPEGITKIGSSAFKDCKNLTSVMIPKTATEICRMAFSGCTSLVSVNIPDGVMKIRESVFSECKSLTSVILPDSVTEIGLRSFSNCKSLTSIILPNSVTMICDSAFSLCSSLTSISIPDSVTKIGNSAFYACNLTSVIIPDSVTEIGEEAFDSCGNLSSVVLSNSITEIKEDTFKSCKSLTSVVIPDGVTKIGDFTFFNCKSLTSIVLPDSVTEIGQDAFDGCTSLTSIGIPGSVTAIRYSTFGDCRSLTSITVPDSVTIMGDRAFEGCTGLTSITIPDSVTEIGKEVFKGCPNLTMICSPDSEAWKYCGKHGIRVSAPNSRMNRLTHFFRSHRK
jgi:hypothetical protein